MTTFRTRWFDRAVIHSDEGFSVHPGRDRLVYCEGKRTMTVTVEMGGKGFDVFVVTIGRWDDDPQHRVDESKIGEISERITMALKSRGLDVRLL